MIQRTLKRTLSIVLTLVLIATTFFIFDPSVLKLDADAIIGVETNPGLASITTPQGVAPETVYLKPGSNAFQYFSNINVTDGIASGSKDATGTVSYKDQSSTDTKLYVNHLWHKVGKTGDSYEDFAISNLNLGITGGVGSQQNITLAGLTATNADPVSGATVIGRGSNSATAVLNTSSTLSNAVRGDVYMIEWAAVSTINGVKHVKFMYTGIYVPLLTITGATANGKHTTVLTNVPKAAGFGFVTGAMAYAEKGNRTTAYTGSTWGVNCAPLVGFVGQQNNGNAGQYTIPNCDSGYSSTISFPDSTPKTIMVVPGTYNANGNGDNYDVWTTYSSWGSYTSPVPTGSNHNDVSEHGGMTTAGVYSGVAYEVIDTSRFTDFSQIPNLSAGFIRYYHDRGGDLCCMKWIRCSDAPNADAPTNGVGCVGVDTGNHDDNEDSWRSRTYGLYPFGGPTPTSSKGMYVMFRYNQDITTYNYPIQLNIGVGLHITSVNKDAQRKGYCAYLTSVVDNVNDTSYSTTYANMKKMACRVCDPTCTDASTVSGCTKSEIESKNTSIISANSGALYFRVPETIYITPSSNSFQYYVNNAAQDTMSPDATPEATTGTFYFNYKGASKVTALYVESVSGSGLYSMTLGGQSLSGGKINIASVTGASTGSINTTITAGSLNAHSDAKLKWTLYYVDKTTNATQSVVAYTYCHVPLAKAAGDNSNTVISVTVHPGYESIWHDNTYACVTGWAAGLYSVDNSGTGSNGNGSYKRNWLYDRSSSVPTCGNKKVTVFYSGTGGSGYWSTNSNIDSCTGGTGTIYIDSSRYTNVGQVPDFYVGIDLNNENNKKERYPALYTRWSNGSDVLVAGDTSTNRSEGWSSGGVHPDASITRYTTTDQTLYIHAWVKTTGNENRTGNGHCYVNVHYRNKAKLRTAYDYYLQNAPVLNPDFFKGSHYSNVMSYLDTVTTYLCDPENTTDQSTMDTAAANLYNTVAQLAGAVTTTQNGINGETTFKYQDINGTLTQNVSRSTYLNSNTAYNYHYSTRTNALIEDQGTNPETVSYFFGDTVYADKNNYKGYTFKYAEVTKPFDGAAICNNRSSNSEASKPISWDPATRTLTFTNNTTGTDNFNQHPGPGANGSAYYYIPVIPKTEVTLTYTATGTTSQVFMSGMGSDMVVPGTSWTDGQNLKSNYSTGNQTLKWTVPENIYYVTFRFGNQTANSSTKFTNIKITLKTAVPDEVNNAAGEGIEWKMYYDPIVSTVTYNPEGGTFNDTTATSETTVKYDETYSVGKVGDSTPDAPTKTGYIFSGWLCSADNIVYNPYDANPTGINFKWKYNTSEVTYSAQWTPIQYDIAFNANGADTETAAVPNPIEDVSYEEKVTLPQKPDNLARTGYTFVGWNTKADGTGTTYTAGQEVSKLTSAQPSGGINAVVTLYAKWSARQYTATAKAYYNTAAAQTTWASGTTGGTVSIDGGTAGATVTKDVACDSNFTVTATPATGYYFVGWYSAAPTTSGWNENNRVTTPTVKMPVGGTTLYARFDIEKYTIKFMRNQNTSDTTVVKTLTSVIYGTSQTVTTPTWTGHTFLGWYDAQSGGNKVYNAESPITIQDKGNNGVTFTYYAHWELTTITVNYAAGDGSGTMSNDTFTYGSNYTPKANTFTAPTAKTVTLKVNGGSNVTDNTTLSSTFTFANWKSSANNATYAAGTAVTDSLGVDTGNTVTLTAQWNQSGVDLPTPVKTGYKFEGWFTVDDESGGEKRNTGYKPTSNETLYARYTIGKYDLNLYAYGNSIKNLDTWTSGKGGTVSGAGTFDYGTDLDISASAKTGYTFVGWYSAAPTTSGWNESTRVTTPAAEMPGENISYWARFDIVSYEVIAKAYYNTAAAQTTWASGTTGGTVQAKGDGTNGTDGSADVASSTANIVEGYTATLVATPKTGYHFVGWYTEAPTSSSSVASESATWNINNISAKTTKYARFDINTSTLTIKPNGGTWNTFTTDKSYTQAYNTKLSVPVPTKTGYNFTGWTESDPFFGTLSGTEYTFPDNKDVESTITANWEAISYSISYTLNGGTHGTNHPDSAGYDTAFAVSAPTKEGYTFTGWTVTAGLDTANAKWGTSSSPATSIGETTKCVNGTSDVYFKNLNSGSNNKSVTLTANWTKKQYTVKLHAMTENNANLGNFTESITGGTVSGGTASGRTYNHGDSVTISASTNTGYTFAGWYSNSGMTTSVSTLPTTVTANIEYWAKFTVNKYTIKFNANTGTGSMSDMTNCVYGISYNLTQNAFTKTGYTFNGWNTAANGSGTAYADKASVTSLSSANNGVATLYAQWKINKYTVTLHAMTEAANGTYSESTSTTGGTVSGAGTFDYGTDLDISATAATGYTFDGWFSNSSMTTSAAVPSTMGDANVELWAKFSISKPLLTLYAYYNTAQSPSNYQNGTTGGTVKIGSGTAGKTATANINYNTTATITASAETGYSFDGWYTGVTGGNGNTVTAWNTGYNGSSCESMTEARTYYAKFSLKSIAVTYNPNGGTPGSVTSATAYYGNDLVIGSDATPTRSGYKLVGWAESSLATEPAYTSGATGTTVGSSSINSWINGGATSKTLYAIWQAYTYEISLIAAYNTSDNVTTYTKGTTGGTITYKPGFTTIKTGDKIYDCINIQPETGYELNKVLYAGITDDDEPDNVTTWTGVSVDDTTTMGEFADGSKVAIVAYFSIIRYTVTAYAYSNTGADTTNYTNSTAGGTVQVGTEVAGKESSAEFYHGDEVSLVAKKKAGYTFDGWFTNAGMTERAETSATLTITVTDDLLYYAKFSINSHDAYAYAEYYEEGIDTATGKGTEGTVGGNVTISYGTTTVETDENNAYVCISSVKYSEDITYTATPATGYEFAGWYYCENTTDKVDIEEVPFEVNTELVVTMYDEDVVFRAKFVPYNFIIVLDPNSGVSGPTAAITVTYDQSYTLDSTAKPTKSGSTFIGWAESSEATSATYDHSNSNCTISSDVINSWYTYGPRTIYAVWTIASYTVTLDNQGATDGITSVTVTVDDPMPPISSSNLPTYEGYKFKGYFTEPGGKGTQYYNEDGTSAKNWNIADDSTLYAKWVCPVLKEATYDEDTCKWTYIYETTDGGTVSSTPQTIDEAPSTENLQPLTDTAPSGAKEITSIDKTTQNNVVNKNKETADIDLNHYSQTALSMLLNCVNETKTDKLRGALSQPELNVYVARVSYYLDLAISKNGTTVNKNTTETYKPSIKLYETKDKLASVKLNTLKSEDSATGVSYDDELPISKDAASYVYTGKWSETKKAAVDYYIYTNSRTPVIALEIDDGEVGASVETNESSYPTKAYVTEENYNEGVVKTTAETYTTGAVPATDKVETAWFKPYIDAGIGVGKDKEDSKNHDYNAKTVLYLTPNFIGEDVGSVTDEIVYTITTEDDAFIEKDENDAIIGNKGVSSAEIADIPKAQKNNFSSFDDDNQPSNKDSITVCISYHNAMNGESDEGGTKSDQYLQFYTDQVQDGKSYYDVWLSQMHLFRLSCGANNWELPELSENVYPVDDPTYAETGYVFGSFAYVFDASNESLACSYADAGNYTMAKNAIIKSIKDSAVEKINALNSGSHKEHFSNKKGLGLFAITGWSSNYYPKQGSYVYAHLIDRWGNVFNRVFKNFQVEDIKTAISGTVSKGFTLNEDGGSHLATLELADTDVEFITDLDSSYENGKFTTTGNTFVVSTGKPASKIPMVVLDNAGNQVSGKIPTDQQGNITFTVTDPTADLTSGAYTFMLNDDEVNLYAREPALVRSSELPSVAINGEPCVVSVKTMDNAAKVQLVENGETRTYTKDMSNVTVIDNGDGTLTWNISLRSLSIGDHTFEVRCKDNKGVWHDSDFTLSTTVIAKPAPAQDAVKKVTAASCKVGERPTLKVTTAEGTDAVRVLYDTGYSTTVYRNSSKVEIMSFEGEEVWKISSGALSKAGDYTASVYVVYNGKSQKENVKSCTITVTEKTQENVVIFSASILNKEAKLGDATKIEVLTGSDTIKLQLVLPNNTTKTYNISDADKVVNNGDGTAIWEISKVFKSVGEHDVIIKVKNASGWSDAHDCGTVTVTK